MKINKDILIAAIDKWGDRAQIAMISEECTELSLILQKTINRSNPEKYREQVIDEIADVNIMIAQANIMWNAEEIQDRIDFKMNRLNNRIADISDAEMPRKSSRKPTPNTSVKS